MNFKTKFWFFLAKQIVMLVLVILFGNNNITEKIIMGFIGVVSLIFGIGHPILFFHVVKNKERYPCLSKLLVKPGYFIDE